MSERPVLKCSVCGYTEFDREAGRLDSLWGLTSHKVAIYICRNCGYVLLFYKGRSIFDFD